LPDDPQPVSGHELHAAFDKLRELIQRLYHELVEARRDNKETIAIINPRRRRDDPPHGDDKPEKKTPD
jgi:hypothetical protein